MNITIETKRVLLRPFKLSDAADVFEFGSNKEVCKYTGDPPLKSIEQAISLIKNVWFSDYEKYGYGRLAVVYKAENKVIGFAGLKYLPEFDKTDIGYRFLPKYWGKGLATEVSKEILKYGFTYLKLNEIIGIADPINVASCKVLEKIGLSLYKKDTYLIDDKLVCNWYKITIKDYLTN